MRKMLQVAIANIEGKESGALTIMCLASCILNHLSREISTYGMNKRLGLTIQQPPPGMTFGSDALLEVQLPTGNQAHTCMLHTKGYCIFSF